MFSTITKVSLIIATVFLVSTSSLMAGSPPPVHAAINNAAVSYHQANAERIEAAHEAATTVEQHQAIAAHLSNVTKAIQDEAKTRHENAVANRQAVLANRQAAADAAASSSTDAVVAIPSETVPTPAHQTVDNIAGVKHNTVNDVTANAHQHSQNVATTKFVKYQANFQDAHENATTVEQHEALNANHITAIKNLHDKNVSVHESINEESASVHGEIQTNRQNYHEAIQAHREEVKANKEAAATVEGGF